MRAIIRNFIHVFKRFKMATFLNVAGLSVAFAAFLVIMMQIDYERTFDRCYPTSDRIFRVDRMRSETDRFGAVVPRAFFDAVVASSPHIEVATMQALAGQYRTYLVAGEEEQRGFRESIQYVYPDFHKLFGLEAVEGDLSLADPEKVIIPESMARKMFGRASAVGQVIHRKDAAACKEDIRDYTVGGVYKDLPVNTQLNNDIYTAYDDWNKGDWHSQNALGYVLLDNSASARLVEEHFNSTFDFTGMYGDIGKSTRLVLTPLTSLYYKPEQAFNKGGNPDTLKLLVVIAFLVIVVAGINYTNFSTSLAPVRIRSINTQKVLGSTQGSLRRALLTEAVGISLVAFGLSLLILAVLNRMQWLSFVEADTRLASHVGLIGVLALISLAVGLAAGLYPAWYMTSFQPALVLKGSFGLSASGRKLRTALIGIQYVVSIGLIIGASFIQLQNGYMRSTNLGFETDQVAVVPLSIDFIRGAKDRYVDRLKSYPGIEEVAFADNLFGGSDDYSMTRHVYHDQEFYCYHMYVSPTFPQVMGLTLADGRLFNHTDEARFRTVEREKRGDKTATYLITRSLAERFQMKAGDNLESGAYIAGIVDDVRAISLRQQENCTDFAFILQSDDLPISYVRLKAGTNAEEAVAHIRKTVEEIDPTYPFDLDFYDQIYDRMYEKEQYLKRMITLFSLLAIVISIVGVFGLVVFETQYRRKEIGIRKVYGATVGEILVMFNKIYVRIVAICFVIAAPIAWAGVDKWLENFAIRTPIYGWTFALALLIVLTITLATVTFQNWHAANQNPVDSIKSE